MTVAVGDVLKVVATILWDDGNVMQNVYAAEITGTGGPYDDADIVDDALAWVEAMYDTLTTQVSAECERSQVQVYIWDAPGDDWDEIGSEVWTWAPTDGADQLPRGVAGLLNSKTTDPDVSGKKYIGGLTEGGVTDGLLNAALLVLLVNYGAEWVVPFAGATSGADWDSGVWSVVGKTLVPFILTTVIPTIPAYQRRRKRGVGV